MRDASAGSGLDLPLDVRQRLLEARQRAALLGHAALLLLARRLGRCRSCLLAYSSSRHRFCASSTTRSASAHVLPRARRFSLVLRSSVSAPTRARARGAARAWERACMPPSASSSAPFTSTRTRPRAPTAVAPARSAPCRSPPAPSAAGPAPWARASWRRRRGGEHGPEGLAELPARGRARGPPPPRGLQALRRRPPPCAAAAARACGPHGTRPRRHASRGARSPRRRLRQRRCCAPIDVPAEATLGFRNGGVRSASEQQQEQKRNGGGRN